MALLLGFRKMHECESPANPSTLWGVSSELIRNARIEKKKQVDNVVRIKNIWFHMYSYV